MSTILDAVIENRYQAVQDFLTGGADPNTIDPSDGTTLVYNAIFFQYYAIAKLLLESGANPNLGSIFPIYDAVIINDLASVKLLLQFGASPDVVFNNSTLLHWATFHALTEIVRALLNAGAFTNVKNEIGETPIQFAVYRNNLVIVNLLLAAGADPAIKSDIGKNAIDYANFYCLVDIIAVLNKSQL